MRGAVCQLSQYVFMAWCLIKKRYIFASWHGAYLRPGTSLPYLVHCRFIIRMLLF